MRKRESKSLSILIRSTPSNLRITSTKFRLQPNKSKANERQKKKVIFFCWHFGTVSYRERIASIQLPASLVLQRVLVCSICAHTHARPTGVYVCPPTETIVWHLWMPSPFCVNFFVCFSHSFSYTLFPSLALSRTNVSFHGLESIHFVSDLKAEKEIERDTRRSVARPFVHSVHFVLCLHTHSLKRKVWCDSLVCPKTDETTSFCLCFFFFFFKFLLGMKIRFVRWFYGQTKEKLELFFWFCRTWKNGRRKMFYENCCRDCLLIVNHKMIVYILTAFLVYSLQHFANGARKKWQTE